MTKQAIVVNYSQMVQEICEVMRQHANFISKYFRLSLDLESDKELLFLAQKFTAVCIALSDLDNSIESVMLSKERTNGDE